MFRRLIAVAAIAGAALLGAGAAQAAQTAPAPSVPYAAQSGGGCSWQYHFSISTLSAGGTAKIYLTSSTCGSGYPHMRAILSCTLRSTVLVYGAWVTVGNTSTAKCSSTTVPTKLQEQVQFKNGSYATYTDWVK